MEKKNRLFSGIKPSGTLTLGSYLGAIQNWKNFIDEYESIFCIVDMHSITVRIDPAELRKNSLTQLAYFIACGLDPERCLLFFQSHVPAHAELAWVLNCYTMFGELSRMTQFKDKSAKNEDNINAGLFTYPVLMAADILLYRAGIVPVGDDQLQHVEICRDIAERFNGLYGETFVIPEAITPKVGARVMSLSDPDSKMSKSDTFDRAGSVYLTDSPDEIMKKFKRAITDSDSAVAYDPANKKGVSNLMSIYSSLTGKSFDEICHMFEGKGYGVFKPAVAEVVIDCLVPIQKKAAKLLGNPDYLEKIYISGAEKAAAIAGGTVKKVYEKVGFVNRARHEGAAK